MSEEYAETETMPGNNGGVLRKGNPKNVGGGRPKDELRAKHFDNAETAANYVAALLDAQAALVEKYQAGEIDETTFLATRMDDQIILRILDYSSKYSIGTKNEVEFVKCDPSLWEKLLDQLKEAAQNNGIEEEVKAVLASVEIPDDWWPETA